MVEVIDHYAYWNKNRSKDENLKIRELNSLQIISALKNKKTFLDAGCGNGKFMLALRQIRPDLILKGVDYSRREVMEAKKHGLAVSQMNFEEGIKLKSNSFDIVYAGEIIEHLYNPDLFLSEINRILKKDGYVIITTPNLLAWFNRILALCGIQPLFLEPSTKSKLVGSGILARLKKESTPVGHVRIFTLQALKDLLAMNGFSIINIKGNPYQEGFPPQILFLDKIASYLSPKIGGQFIILAKKIQ